MWGRPITTKEYIFKALKNFSFTPSLLHINHQETPYMRIEISIDNLTPLSWLNLQTMYPKIYWESPKEHLIVAGIGSALAFSYLPICHNPKAPRFFGGEDFCLRKKETWNGVPSSWYNLPLIEVTKENAQNKLCFNLTQDIDLKNLVNQLTFDLTPLEETLKKPITRQDLPSCYHWQQNISHCLDLIEKKRIKKVVLARLTRFDFQNSLNPYQILKKLQKGSETPSLFCFEFRRGLSFLGASPEILYKKVGQHIITAAVAGTRRRGKNQAEDEKLCIELLNSFKDLHEFQVVEDHISKTLNLLCKKMTKKVSQQILKTPNVQHITSIFEGTLDETVSDTDIIKTLQPTPAVCGHPKNLALDVIKKMETFDRGWYSAPVGWTCGDKAHFLVGIRSSLIRDSALHLFAATGIVKGSVPYAEWKELEQKISPIYYLAREMTLDSRHLNAQWARILIKELIHQGIRYFCISPGFRSTPLIFAAKEHPLAKIFVHFDERGMAYHALGYAKANRLPVALIITSGTALGNILPAIMEADSDEIPLIVLTADRPPELIGCGANQTTDQVKIYTNFVRHQVNLPCPSPSICTRFIGTTIAESVSFTLKAPKGPVHINCMFREPFFKEDKEDDLSPDFPHSAQTTLALGKASLSIQEIEGIAEDLIEHEKGIILVGQMETWATLEPLLKLSRFLQWPIFPDVLSELRSLGKANGVIPSFDLILQTIGMNEDLSPNVILQFGDRFVSKKLMQWLSFTKPKFYAHIAEHTNRKDPIHALTHRIHSDPFTFCEKLSNQLSGKMPSSWMKFWTDCSEKTEQVVSRYLKEQEKLTEPKIFQSLPSFLLKHSALFLSNSMPIRNAESFFFLKSPWDLVFANRGLSGIDGNIATAIGIAAGIEKPLIAILGDLSFLHDMNSLAQVKDSPFPISFLVINNNGGSIFLSLPLKESKKNILPLLLNPHNLDISHIAPLFNLTYENPKSLSELKQVVKKTESECCLIEVQTKIEDNFEIHEEIIAHIKEMQASASIKLSSR